MIQSLRMQTRSVRLAATALVLAVVAPVTAQSDPGKTEPSPAPEVALPEAREILSKGVDAVGGKEALLKVKSIEMKGSIEMPAQGIKGTMIARTAAPNKMMTSMNLGALGEFRTGYDGTVGWASDKIQGTRLLEGKELATIAREADFLKDADPLKRWDSVKTVADGKFGGFDCWKIEAAKGDEKAVLWYEKSTHLARGLEMVLETQFGKIPMSTAFLEYRDFNGVKLPVRSEAKQAGQKIVTVFESIALDSVDASTLELPAEVKALLEPEPTDGEDGETSGAPASAPAPAKP